MSELSEINVVSSEAFYANEDELSGESIFTSWNGRNVEFFQKVKQAFPIFNYLKVVCYMERVRQPRELEAEGVFRYENGKVSGGVGIEAPSKDGKDKVSFDAKVDQDGNVSAELGYKCKFGGKKEEENKEKK